MTFHNDCPHKCVKEISCDKCMDKPGRARRVERRMTSKPGKGRLLEHRQHTEENWGLGKTSQ